MEHVRRITLRRERKRPGLGVDPCVEAVHQDDSARWRRRGRQQERVIPARPDAGRCARREPAEAIGLQPLRPIVNLHV